MAGSPGRNGRAIGVLPPAGLPLPAGQPAFGRRCDVHTVIVLFTRDLRVSDNPALESAVRQAERVVPLFVLDPRLPAAERRLDFLAECLTDLRGSLRRLGGDLVIRVGDPVAEAVRLALDTAAAGIVLARDVSAFARRRERRMAQACATHRLVLTLVDSGTLVPAGAVRPSGGGDHYRVFTPYWRAWCGFRWRAELPAPDRIVLPDGIQAGSLPATGPGEGLMPGGEHEGRRRLGQWRHEVGDYAARRDDLAADRTSRLSPYLHFGCLSPV
jgi:deoxyribodipyrimidine photo-lyase